jgi:2-polyprenyl-3-methyl-5-hydroxy-6-metoxy-1,4-benzoquinol methylase
MTLDRNSLERLVPDQLDPNDATGRETERLHIARYQFASVYVRPGRLLDIACGVGYGTRFLADECAHAVLALGADISKEAIEYARRRYASDRVRFVAADARRFSDANGFDTIVSLETIEHLPDPAGFVSRLVTLLRPGGVIVGSVPTTPSVDANPYHFQDFTERSFRAMFRRHGLTEIACFRQVQPFKVAPLLTKREARAKDIRRNLPLYYLSHPTSLVRRIWCTARHGFVNRYITIAWKTAG